MIEQFDALIQERLGFSLRDHQKEALALGHSIDKGVFEIGTGGGKSVIMAGLAFKDKTLIVVDSIVLLKQTTALLRKLYPDVGEFGGGVHKWGRITVGIPKSLRAWPAKLREFTHCVWDECHTGIGFDKNFDPHDNILDVGNFQKIHGFTGTYLRRTKEEEIAQRRMFGPRLMRIGVSELIAEEALPSPDIFIVHDIDKEAAEEMAVVLVDIWRKKKGLVLVKLVDDCTRLANRMHVIGCHGKVKGKERDLAIAQLAAGKTHAIVATKIFEKGVDIPTVDYAINLKNEIGETGCRQSVGRILRGSSAKTYVDFDDGSLAAMNRKRIYMNEWGFSTHFISVGEMINIAEGVIEQ